ncbi:uncharacterized protein TRUGW13939_01330 [Talaromyces rugulosus]|uniref:Uncharacterized protein n=1 Tax=Talaromyces rugulosus TaxID=121627 RepID=A0A7H8QL66_TALRU|nr:uncharacterized protein TRUGW13939_01330 [Talaromyces rugulosus]QKX54245.1 hypothetical protein TRUGW13939_01330 [Talaromyces rugulosus]
MTIDWGGPYPYLDLWISNANEGLCHPETYCDVILCITQRVKDLDFSALVHKAIRGSLGYTSERAVHFLLSDLHPRPANVNALNDDGHTPLLAVLQSLCKGRKLSSESPHSTLESIISKASTLLRAGAQLDFISSSGNTSILSPVSNHRSRWRSDDEDVRLMESLLNFNNSIDAGSEPSHWKLVDITPTIALTRAAFMGRTKTVKFHLDHGMHNRLGELVRFEYIHDRIFSGSLLDIAFFGAQQTRREYIQLVDPESHPEPYKEDSNNSIEGWAYFRLSETYTYQDSDTAKNIGEARYRGHSEIVQLLQSHGVKRTRPEEPENEPTYFKAVTMPRTSFFNLDAVSDLTTVEEWDKTALDELVFDYTRLRAWPRPAVLDRWPSLQGKLPFAESQVRKEFFLNAWHPSRPSGFSSQDSSETIDSNDSGKDELYEDSDDTLESIDSDISS